MHKHILECINSPCIAQLESPFSVIIAAFADSCALRGDRCRYDTNFVAVFFFFHP